jgi:hypothetical protein
MKKPANTGAALKTRTASWQYDSADYAEGIDNKNHPSYKALTKYSGNQHGGAAEGNFGRGATKGNTNPTGVGPKQAPTAALKDTAAGCNSCYAGTFNAGAQVRTPGGVKEMPKRGRESFDFGRGPTRGNAQ